MIEPVNVSAMITQNIACEDFCGPEITGASTSTSGTAW